MPVPAGTQSVGAPVNITGVLLAKTDTRTPLFNMLGGAVIGSREFVLGAEYELGAASQPAISETASLTAPTPSYDQPTNAKNVTQIFQRAVSATYRKMSDVETLTGTPYLEGQSNNVQNPLAFSIANRTAEIRNDMEYTIINGVYQLAANADQADKTRGLNAAIVSNVIAAGDAELSPDMLISMARKIAALSPYGLSGVVGVLNAEQVVQLNKIITDEGHRASMNDAGSNLLTYLTPFGRLNFLEGGHRYQPNGTAGFYRLPSCRNVLQPVPGKGNFFYEALAKTGAGESGHIYGQWGLDYDHEWLHGKITGLKQTTAAGTAPKVYVDNTATAPVYTKAV